ncbi:ras-related C3 botulinum toxin substrate 1-like [Physella acuta]|uniref:ras-related C3 botulinum toxin substrate 1-like n=1 Tax=Physella acuta TaxID=109671 RepID=UPI0027DD1598|nr:ras-related C3 botulinum toxin substrate 1-like [Physella acuta]
MVQRFCEGSFRTAYFPPIFYHSTVEMTVDEKKVSLDLISTSGQEDYDRLRPLSYPGADCFILCFSLCSEDSAEDIKEKWYPEIRYHCPYAPFILVGTKLDVRQDKDMQAGGEKVVSKSEGEKIGKSIKAYRYLECSALTQEGLKDVFEEVVRAILYQKPKHKSNCKGCVML